jgi:hypothetical protein
LGLELPAQGTLVATPNLTFVLLQLIGTLTPASGIEPTEPDAMAVTTESTIPVVDRADNRVVSFEPGV